MHDVFRSTVLGEAEIIWAGSCSEFRRVLLSQCLANQTSEGIACVQPSDFGIGFTHSGELAKSKGLLDTSWHVGACIMVRNIAQGFYGQWLFQRHLEMFISRST